jgi:hypothetical protein
MPPRNGDYSRSVLFGHRVVLLVMSAVMTVAALSSRVKAVW